MRRAFLEYPVIRYVPMELLLFSLGGGAYGTGTREVVSKLHNRSRQDTLVASLVQRDLENLRHVPKMNAYTAKTYFYKKYKLSNKDVMQIAGHENVGGALDTTHQPVTVMDDGRTIKKTHINAPTGQEQDDYVRLPPKCRYNTGRTAIAPWRRRRQPGI